MPFTIYMPAYPVQTPFPIFIIMCKQSSNRTPPKKRIKNRAMQNKHPILISKLFSKDMSKG